MPTSKKNRLPECRIDLTDSGEKFVSNFLVLSAPLWLLASFLLFSSLGFTIAHLIGCLCFYVAYRILNTHQIIFEHDCVRLPGTFRPTYLYSEITEIELDAHNALRFSAGAKALRKITLGGLSREDAAKLWTIFATRFKNAHIAPEVRERLKNWIGEVEPQKGIAISSELAAQNQSDNNLQLTLSLKAHSMYSQALSYLMVAFRGFDRSMGRLWLILCLAAAFTFTTRRAVLNHLLYSLSDLFETFNKVLSHYFSAEFLLLLSLTGVVGMLCLIVWSLYSLIERFTKPDCLFIDHLGFTALLSTPTGSVPKEHLGWQSIASIKLFGQRSSGTGGFIEVTPNIDRPPIQIPVRTLTASRNRQLFLEAVNAWGQRVEVDAKILALMNRADTSYTELWLSSLQSRPELQAVSPLQNGSKLAHHDLVIASQLAAGGQAVTYVANCPEFEDKIVLKEFILPFYNEPLKRRITARFEHDAKLLQSLEHPQVVKLHHYFIEGQRAFLMLEYIQGTTLKEKVLTEGPLTEDTVIGLIEQMASILVYLHSRTPPVVHRDFTADNIVINDAGTIKLLDFDVATNIDQETTARGTFAGKQNYLPPEQFQGHPCPQSDIYALGATAYYLLTGCEPEPLTVSRPQNLIAVSDNLNALVARCTEPELAARLGSAEELLQQIKIITEKLAESNAL